MKLKKVLLKQQGDYDCGVSALRMLLAYVHHDLNYLTIPLPEKLDNFLAISKVGAKYGVTLEGYALREEGALSNLTSPFIAQISRGGVNHFVLAFVKGKKLFINDPSGDYYVLPLKKDEKYLISNILVVKDVRKVEKLPKVALPRQFKTVSLQTLFLFFISVGFFFLGHDHLDLISYIAFTAAALTKIIEQHLLLLHVKEFDNRMTIPFLRKKHQHFKKDYSLFQSAKMTVITYPLKLFNGLTTILFISVLLSLNNVFLLIICALLIMFALGITLNDNKKGVKIWRLANLEGDLLKAQVNHREMTYRSMVLHTNDLAKNYVYRNIIMHFLIGVIIFLLMYFSRTYSLNFFLFYFFAFSYYFSELQKLFSLVTNRATYYSAINTLIN